MKRDSRLRRSGERVDRTLGGMYRRPRYYPTPTVRASVTARIARGMRLPLRLLTGAPSYYAGYAEAEHIYIEHVLRPHAEHVTAEMAEHLRHDLTFRGEAYVHVGWDLERDAVTYQRIPPDEIA